MQPETLFLMALAVAVVVIVLAIRKTRRRADHNGNADDRSVSE